jgi:NAD(P)H-hydrate epimerase
MMENAGRSLALLAKRMLDGSVADSSVVVLAGKGNNGGGGMVAARHLHNWGAWAQVVLTDAPERFEGVAAEQLAALRASGAPLAWAEEGWELPPADLVIDAVIGYGLRGNPRGKARDLIQLANSSAAPILSLDVPSGVDSTDGRCYTPHIRAAATLTLALPKTGMLHVPARSACGRIFVADIGVPPALYASMGLQVAPFFGKDPILELVTEGERVWVSG